MGRGAPFSCSPRSSLPRVPVVFRGDFPALPYSVLISAEIQELVLIENHGANSVHLYGAMTPEGAPSHFQAARMLGEVVPGWGVSVWEFVAVCAG